MKTFYESVCVQDWDYMEATCDIVGREVGERNVKHHGITISVSSDAPGLNNMFQHDVVDALKTCFQGDIRSFEIIRLKIVQKNGFTVTFEKNAFR